jgi:hypothetical protein
MGLFKSPRERNPKSLPNDVGDVQLAAFKGKRSAIVISSGKRLCESVFSY